MSDTKIRVRKATAQLREDHQAVKKMFREFEKAEDVDEKAELFGKIKTELTVHAQIEEEIFYPAMEEVEDEECAEMLKESYEEHKVVKTLLEELSGMEPGDEQFDAKVTVMGENVEHHAEEEEQELFPYFDELPKDVQEDVSERLDARKRELTEGDPTA